MVANNDLRAQKVRRIEQLSKMCKDDPVALASELEAMTEILWDMYGTVNSPEIRVLIGMVADLATILTIKNVMDMDDDARNEFLEENHEDRDKEG